MVSKFSSCELQPGRWQGYNCIILDVHFKFTIQKAHKEWINSKNNKETEQPLVSNW